jgi:hypothetical protein
MIILLTNFLSEPDKKYFLHHTLDAIEACRVEYSDKHISEETIQLENGC